MAQAYSPCLEKKSRGALAGRRTPIKKEKEPRRGRGSLLMSVTVSVIAIGRRRRRGRRAVVVTVIIAIMVRRSRNGAQGEQADAKADQGAGIITAAMPAAIMPTAAVTPSATMAISLSRSRGGAQQRQGQCAGGQCANQAFHGFVPFFERRENRVVERHHDRASMNPF